jgi:hypothetical protein
MTKACFRTQKYRIAGNFIFYVKLNEFPGILEGKMEIVKCINCWMQMIFLFRLMVLDEEKEKLIDRLRS